MEKLQNLKIGSPMKKDYKYSLIQIYPNSQNRIISKYNFKYNSHKIHIIVLIPIKPTQEKEAITTVQIIVNL